jgi:hypothetical protein
MQSVNPSATLGGYRERPSTSLGTNVLEFIEGRSRTIKFITLGCKVNQYDTQSIREQFANAGFKEIDNGRMADIYVINTCTVTSIADRKSRYFIHYAHRQNPNAIIIVTGCYAVLDSDEIAGIPGVTHIIKNQDKDKIVELLDGQNGFNGQMVRQAHHCRIAPKIFAHSFRHKAWRTRQRFVAGNFRRRRTSLRLGIEHQYVEKFVHLVTCLIVNNHV